MAITGTHAILYTSEPDALRACLQDVFGWPSVDAGHGWLIFSLPPAELGIHPGDGPAHQLSFMCDDIGATMAELRGNGIVFTGEPTPSGFGIVATMVAGLSAADRTAPACYAASAQSVSRFRRAPASNCEPLVRANWKLFNPALPRSAPQIVVIAHYESCLLPQNLPYPGGCIANRKLLETMANALQNVVPSHLADGTLFGFDGLKASGVADADGDKAFDVEDFGEAPTLPGLAIVKL